MRTSIFLFLILSAATFMGCLKDDCTETRTFIRLDPVYISQAELDDGISSSGPRELERPGIIYSYGKYLLINEYQKGIHLIDNSDPSNPTPISFIDIAANEHFAVFKNQIQANRYNALVTIDITDPQNPVEKNRIESAFEEFYFQEGRGYLAYYRESDQSQVLDCADPNFNSVRWSNGQGGPIFFATRQDLASFESSFADRGGSGSGGGTGGSTARFTIAANHLYAVNNWELQIFDLEDACKPSSVSRTSVGWGIETIYPFQDKLFIGSNSGMFIYDISTPAEPLYLTSFNHATACDPVVSDGETAYVTLRDGSLCQGFINQLDVVDVSNVTHPKLIDTYQMDNPHGLAINNDVLYVCEGIYGLKVLDRSNPKKMKELGHLKNVDARDIIVLGSELAMVVGRDGLKQYTLKNPAKPVEISTIPVINY